MTGLPAFDNVPRTAEGYFALHVHAAVDQLVSRLRPRDQAASEDLLQRYEFLTEHRRRLDAWRIQPHERPPMRFWMRAIEAWRSGTERRYPLDAFSEMGLGFRARLAYVLGGIVEEDPRFGSLFQDLQAPLVGHEPTLETLRRVVASQSPAVDEPLTQQWRTLVHTGLLTLGNTDRPRLQQSVSPTAALWEAAKGQLDHEPWRGVRYLPPNECCSLDSVILPSTVLHEFERLPETLRAGQTEVVVVRAPLGTDVVELCSALARALGLALVTVGDSSQEHASIQALGTFCRLSAALPLLRYAPAPGESVELPRWDAYRGPLVVALAREGGIVDPLERRTLTVEVPFPPRRTRFRLWQRALPAMDTVELEQVSQRLLLSGQHISQVANRALAQAALEGELAPNARHVRTASGRLSRHALETLAEPLEAAGSWDDLVTAPETFEQLLELQRRCDHREVMATQLGSAFAGGPGRGVRALFSGASGTGKTMAARILASELGMDLFRVDLAAVVDKYVGETEKRLHKVLTLAEALSIILLLDEGDSFLARRTEVRSANDRYANLETNYLLQRLESYQGIVVVTTNAPDHIDRAFQRRMDMVVQFARPKGASERLRIWELHLPKNHDLDAEFLAEVAHRCPLTGGQIRNVVLQATSTALHEHRLLNAGHLRHGLLREQQKAGTSSSMLGIGVRRRQADTLRDFVAALRER